MIGGPVTFQISLDQANLESALRLADLAAEAGVQTLEAGTGLILSEGARRVLPALRSRHSNLGLVADIKCTDGAFFEIGQMFDLGATAATVMGFASDASIWQAVRAASVHPGCAVMVDTMGAGGPDGADIEGHVMAARRARDLGAHYAVVHLGYDERGDNPRMVEESLLLRWAEAVARADLGIAIQVVGGLTLAQAKVLPNLGIRDIVISMNLGSRPAGEMRYEDITAFTVNLDDEGDCRLVREQIRRFIDEVNAAG